MTALFAVFVIISSAIHLTRSAETPPWRSNNQQNLNAGQNSSPSKPKEKQEPFSFLTLNVRNWLISPQSPIKSPESKAVTIRIISEASPDVVGLCEVGSPSDLAEIQAMLKKAGLDLPHQYHTGGVDTVRHLAILSRFPIQSHTKPKIEIPGESNFSMQRGILDVTILIENQPVRFIGLHLKSKRVVPHFDQAFLRSEEARHVRNYIDSILLNDPSAQILLYGDLNDNIRSPSTRAILGKYQTPTYLTHIPLKDSRGDTWTHFYDQEDSYSRIDFIAVSKSLRPKIDRNQSKILDPPDWFTASDHRALLVTFK
jgi:endonuclease/exonuclease/phosphatase family metal-dependent hydrolase